MIEMRLDSIEEKIDRLSDTITAATRRISVDIATLSTNVRALKDDNKNTRRVIVAAVVISALIVIAAL